MKITIRPYADTVEISTYVHKEHQNQGIGLRLKAAIIEKAKLLGMHCIISRVAGENKASNRLNEKLGFTYILEQCGRWERSSTNSTTYIYIN